jgi:hypothetical protein
MYSEKVMTIKISIKGATFFAMMALIANEAAAQNDPDVVSGSGSVVSVAKGIVYRRGVPNQIVSIKTNSGDFRILFPTISMNPIQVGEKVAFSGKHISIFGIGDSIDTSEYYVARPTEKTMAETQAEMMAQMSNVTDPAAAAIPSVTVETKEQINDRISERQSNARREWFDILIGIFGIFLGIANREKILQTLKLIFENTKKIVTSTRDRFRQNPIEKDDVANI